MDTVSLYYFVELAKNLNMTKTAERLYTSQQTLSNHIQRLEQYYGIALFYRKPVLSLTCAGELVLAFAQNMEKENGSLKSALLDIEQQGRGLLSIGASLTRGMQFLSRVLPTFSQKYPRVQIRFADNHSTKLEDMVLNGELDCAIILNSTDPPSLVHDELLRDQIYLCVPENLLQQHYGQIEAANIKARSRYKANFTDFVRIPFSLVANRMGDQLWKYFMLEQYTPIVYFTGTYSYQALPFCSSGLAACYCTQMTLIEGQHNIGPNVNVFPLFYQEEPICQRLSLVWHKQRHLPYYTRYFLDLLMQTADQLERIDVCRTVPDESL